MLYILLFLRLILFLPPLDLIDLLECFLFFFSKSFKNFTKTESGKQYLS